METSTPAKLAEGELTEGVLGLDLSEPNETIIRDSSFFTDDENPHDGSLEKVDTRTAKQMNKARRNRERRARREEALAAGVRLINNKQWRTNPGETIGEKAHSKVIENWKNEMKELDHPQDKLIVKEKVIALYETRIEPRENIRKEDTKPMPKQKK